MFVTVQEVRDRHRLTCRWETNNKPLLMIQPAKLEEVHLKPWIVLYHGLLSDQEIETIKKIALPRVSMVLFNGAGGGGARGVMFYFNYYYLLLLLLLVVVVVVVVVVVCVLSMEKCI